MAPERRPSKRRREQKQRWQEANKQRRREVQKVYDRSLAGRYTALKRNAKVRGLECQITREEHISLLALPCHYCGGTVHETSAGLDRLDNDRGYFVDNVVTCCGPCNSIRGDKLTYEEMLVAMKAVLELRAKA